MYFSNLLAWCFLRPLCCMITMGDQGMKEGMEERTQKVNLEISGASCSTILWDCSNVAMDSSLPTAMGMLDSIAFLEAVVSSWESKDAGTDFSIIRDFPKRNSLMGSFPLSFTSFTVEIIDCKTLALKFFMVMEFETVQSLTSIET